MPPINQGQRPYKETRKHSAPFDSFKNGFGREETTSSNHLDTKPIPFDPRPESSKSRAAMSGSDKITSPDMGEAEKQVEKVIAHMASRFVTDVEIVEKEAHDNLGDLSSRYHEMCTILADAENQLGISIPEERYTIADSTTGIDSEPMTLGDRVQGYRGELKSKMEELRASWDRLAIVQRDMIVVAVQVCGKDIIIADAEKISPDFWNVVDTAQACYEQECEDMAKIVDKLSQLQVEMENISKQSTKESRRHLKEIRLVRKKQIARATNAFKVVIDG